MVKQDDIQTMKFSANGSPFCRITIGETNPEMLSYQLDGSPWWAVLPIGEETVTYIYGNIKRVSKVNWGYIKRVTTVTGH